MKSEPSPSLARQNQLRKELAEIARDLLDEWDCSGGVRYWSDEAKRSYIARAADLAAYVLEILGVSDDG